MNNWNSTSAAPERRPRHAEFHFLSSALQGHTLQLHYALRGGPDPDQSFCERLTLPAGLPPPNRQDPAIQALVRACHLAFGVSYYKAALPPQVVLSAPGYDRLTLQELAFWDLLYSDGLGEFYFRNGLPVPADVGFLRQARPAAARDPAANDASANRAEAPTERALVLIGGGKDSGLVADMVQTSGVAAAALSLGDSPWMARSAAAAGMTLHRIGRQIDPALLTLNAQGAWNGHVPISACIAAVACLVARTGGFTDVLVGNERGANDANVVWQGRPINHQWSKSSRFEQAFQHWSHYAVGPWPRYASVLRPLSEIRIAAAFAQCPAQHAHFTSCNRNFRQSPGARPARWCGVCAKCVFVALILAPHLDAARTATIFDTGILTNPENRPHLLALLGLADVKPWDCVGTAQECWLSLLALQRQGRLPAELAALAAQAPATLLGNGFDRAWAAEWASQPSPDLSPAWRARLDAYLGTA